MTTKPENKRSIIAALTIGTLAIGGLIAIAAASDTGPAPALTGTDEPTPEQTACMQDWHKCTTNADVMKSSKALAYSRQCKELAIKQAHFGEPKFAKYDVPFTTWLEGDDFAKFGIIALWSKDVQLQNAYGAWQNVTMLCQLNLDTMKMGVATVAQ
jgi:hypothetical protein